jgi:ribosome-binding factor A
MSKRIERVNSLLENEISKILLRDFDFFGVIVTLTHVETTHNLIEARVYISIFPEEKNYQIIKTLNLAVYDIQQKINKKLNMRPIPKIIFMKDEKIKEAARIEKILERLKKPKN